MDRFAGGLILVQNGGRHRRLRSAASWDASSIATCLHRSRTQPMARHRARPAAGTWSCDDPKDARTS